MVRRRMLRSLVRFLIKRNSETAALLIMDLVDYLNMKDLRDQWQYLKAVEENRKQPAGVILEATSPIRIGQPVWIDKDGKVHPV